MQRLEPVISEMEREGESIVIVSHQVGVSGSRQSRVGSQMTGLRAAAADRPQGCCRPGGLGWRPGLVKLDVEQGQRGSVRCAV